LHLERDEPDLVKKQGTTMRRLESARASSGRAGEGAFFRAEQFRFDEVSFRFNIAAKT